MDAGGIKSIRERLGTVRNIFSLIADGQFGGSHLPQRALSNVLDFLIPSSDAIVTASEVSDSDAGSELSDSDAGSELSDSDADSELSDSDADSELSDSYVDSELSDSEQLRLQEEYIRNLDELITNLLFFARALSKAHYAQIANELPLHLLKDIAQYRKEQVEAAFGGVFRNNKSIEFLVEEVRRTRRDLADSKAILAGGHLEALQASYKPRAQASVALEVFNALMLLTWGVLDENYGAIVAACLIAVYAPLLRFAVYDESFSRLRQEVSQLESRLRWLQGIYGQLKRITDVYASLDGHASSLPALFRLDNKEAAKVTVRDDEPQWTGSRRYQDSMEVNARQTRAHVNAFAGGLLKDATGTAKIVALIISQASFLGAIAKSDNVMVGCSAAGVYLVLLNIGLTISSQRKRLKDNRVRLVKGRGLGRTFILDQLIGKGPVLEFLDPLSQWCLLKACGIPPKLIASNDQDLQVRVNALLARPPGQATTETVSFRLPGSEDAHELQVGLQVRRSTETRSRYIAGNGEPGGCITLWNSFWSIVLPWVMLGLAFVPLIFVVTVLVMYPDDVLRDSSDSLSGSGSSSSAASQESDPALQMALIIGVTLIFNYPWAKCCMFLFKAIDKNFSCDAAGSYRATPHVNEERTVAQVKVGAGADQTLLIVSRASKWRRAPQEPRYNARGVVVPAGASVRDIENPLPLGDTPCDGKGGGAAESKGEEGADVNIVMLERLARERVVYEQPGSISSRLSPGGA